MQQCNRLKMALKQYMLLLTIMYSTGKQLCRTKMKKNGENRENRIPPPLMSDSLKTISAGRRLDTEIKGNLLYYYI